MTRKRLATIIGFTVTLAALLLQISLTVPLRLEKGDSLIGALVYYFTFFTIITNLMLVGIYLSELVAAKWLGWWRMPATRGMMAGAITLVMLFYHFVLGPTWNPQGLFLVADTMLHYVDPLIYLGWWVAFMPHGKLRLGDLPAMLILPAAWLGWAMARGAVAGEYPYPILEANRLGYGQVAINCGLVLLGLVALYAVAIAIDRALRGRDATTA